MSTDERDESRIVISNKNKRSVIKWQSWIQAKTGKYISQGNAVTAACIISLVFLDAMPYTLRKAGKEQLAKMFDDMMEKVTKEWLLKFTEGELEAFDFEEIISRKS